LIPIHLVRLLILLAVLFLVAGVWNMTLMAPHIGSWAKRGSFNSYAFILDVSDFKDPEGMKYRNRYYACLALFLLALLLLSGVIIMLPNGTQL